MAINMTKAFYTHKCNETVPTSLWNSHLLGWKQFELNNHFNQPGTLEGIDFAHLFAWWPPICAHVTHDSVCSSSMCARVPISILPHYPCPWSRNVTRALWAGKLWWPLAWWPVVTSGDQGDGPGYGHPGHQCSHHPHTPLAAQWRVSPLWWRARPRFNYYLQLSRVSECRGAGTRDINISSISHSPKPSPFSGSQATPRLLSRRGKLTPRSKLSYRQEFHGWGALSPR